MARMCDGTTTDDYRKAVSGEVDASGLAAQWSDKPHRLVYDLCGEVDALRAIVADYEQMQRQHREHVRRLDIALNGDGAAKQASLIDLVAQFERR